MNGQHLRVIPSEELTKLIGEQWKSTGILKESEGPFVEVRILLAMHLIAVVACTCLESARFYFVCF